MIRRLAVLLCAPVVLGAQRAQSAQSRMKAQMNDIVSLLRRTPAIAQLNGYTLDPHLLVEQQSPGKMVNGRLMALLIAGNTAHGEGLGLNIDANNVSCARGEHTDYQDAGGAFYTAVTPHMIHGFPAYADHGCILLTKRMAPPAIPVTRERAIRALLKLHQDQPNVVNELQKELAAMSPAERSAQAILDVGELTKLQMGDKGGPVLASNESQTAYRLVAQNPAFYDHTRPGDIQALVVGFDCMDGHGSQFCAQYPGVFEKIRDTMDWDALMAMVKP